MLIYIIQMLKNYIFCLEWLNFPTDFYRYFRALENRLRLTRFASKFCEFFSKNVFREPYVNISMVPVSVKISEFFARMGKKKYVQRPLSGSNFI